MVKRVARGQLTIVDLTDSRSLVAYISSNLPKMVIYNPETDEYTPSYSTTPLILEPTLYVTGGDGANLISQAKSVEWFYKEVGQDRVLIEGETGSNYNLIVNSNPLVGKNFMTYICEITVEDNITKLDKLITAEFEIFRVENGSKGDTGQNFVVDLTNETHTIPYNSETGEHNFVGSGTYINVFQNTTQLQYQHTGELTNGKFKVEARFENVSGLMKAEDGQSAILESLTDMTENAGLVDFRIIIKGLNGENVVQNKQMTISRAVGGRSAVAWKLMFGKNSVVLRQEDNSIVGETTIAATLQRYIGVELKNDYSDMNIGYTVKALNIDGTVTDIDMNSDKVIVLPSKERLTINLSNFTQNERKMIESLIVAAVNFDTMETLDTETIPFIRNGLLGTSPYSIVISNENHSFLRDENGAVNHLTDSGTIIRLFKGNNEMRFKVAGSNDDLAPNEYRVERVQSFGETVLTLGEMYAGAGKMLVVGNIQHIPPSSQNLSLSGSINYKLFVKDENNEVEMIEKAQTINIQNFAHDAVLYRLGLTSNNVSITADGLPSEAQIIVTASEIRKAAMGEPKDFDGKLKVEIVNITTQNQFLLNGTYNGAFTIDIENSNILDNAKSIKVTLTSADESTTYDSETIMVIREAKDGFDGESAIFVSLSNDSHTIPFNTNTNEAVYEGSGTDISVYHGTQALQYTPFETLANGTFKVTATSFGVSTGEITEYGASARMGDVSNVTSDLGRITFRIEGLTQNGLPFEINKTMTLSIVRSGEDATVWRLNTDIGVLPVTKDNILSFNNVVATVSKYVGSELQTEDIRDEHALKCYLVDYDGDLHELTGIFTPPNMYSFSLNNLTNLEVQEARSLRLELLSPDLSQVLDHEELAFVRDGQSGQNAISATLTNETHTLAKNKNGQIISYVGSNTDFVVYEGASILNFEASLANTGAAASSLPVGSYTLDIYASNIEHGDITKDNITGLGKMGDVKNYTGDGTLPVTIQFVFRGRRLNGSEFISSKLMTLSAVESGENALFFRMLAKQTAIKLDKRGILSNELIDILVEKIDGANISTALPTGMLVQVSTVLHSGVESIVANLSPNTNTGIAQFSLASIMPISDYINMLKLEDGSKLSKLKFSLLSTAGQEFDTQEIPFIIDGLDGIEGQAAIQVASSNDSINFISTMQPNDNEGRPSLADYQSQFESIRFDAFEGGTRIAIAGVAVSNSSYPLTNGVANVFIDAKGLTLSHEISAEGHFTIAGITGVDRTTSPQINLLFLGKRLNGDSFALEKKVSIAYVIHGEDGVTPEIYELQIKPSPVYVLPFALIGDSAKEATIQSLLGAYQYNTIRRKGNIVENASDIGNLTYRLTVKEGSNSETTIGTFVAAGSSLLPVVAHEVTTSLLNSALTVMAQLEKYSFEMQVSNSQGEILDRQGLTVIIPDANAPMSFTIENVNHTIPLQVDGTPVLTNSGGGKVFLGLSAHYPIYATEVSSALRDAFDSWSKKEDVPIRVQFGELAFIKIDDLGKSLGITWDYNSQTLSNIQSLPESLRKAGNFRVKIEIKGVYEDEASGEYLKGFFHETKYLNYSVAEAGLSVEIVDLNIDKPFIRRKADGTLIDNTININAVKRRGTTSSPHSVNFIVEEKSTGALVKSTTYNNTSTLSYAVSSENKNVDEIRFAIVDVTNPNNIYDEQSVMVIKEAVSQSAIIMESTSNPIILKADEKGILYTNNSTAIFKFFYEGQQLELFSSTSKTAETLEVGEAIVQIESPSNNNVTWSQVVANQALQLLNIQNQGSITDESQDNLLFNIKIKTLTPNLSLLEQNFSFNVLRIRKNEKEDFNISTITVAHPLQSYVNPSSTRLDYDSALNSPVQDTPESLISTYKTLFSHKRYNHETEKFDAPIIPTGKKLYAAAYVQVLRNTGTTFYDAALVMGELDANGDFTLTKDSLDDIQKKNLATLARYANVIQAGENSSRLGAAKWIIFLGDDTMVLDDLIRSSNLTDIFANLVYEVPMAFSTVERTFTLVNSNNNITIQTDGKYILTHPSTTDILSTVQLVADNGSIITASTSTGSIYKRLLAEGAANITLTVKRADGVTDNNIVIQRSVENQSFVYRLISSQYSDISGSATFIERYNYVQTSTSGIPFSTTFNIKIQKQGTDAVVTLLKVPNSTIQLTEISADYSQIPALKVHTLKVDGDTESIIKKDIVVSLADSVGNEISKIATYNISSPSYDASNILSIPAINIQNIPSNATMIKYQSVDLNDSNVIVKVYDTVLVPFYKTPVGVAVTVDNENMTFIKQKDTATSTTTGFFPVTHAVNVSTLENGQLLTAVSASTTLKKGQYKVTSQIPQGLTTQLVNNTSSVAVNISHASMPTTESTVKSIPLTIEGITTTGQSFTLVKEITVNFTVEANAIISAEIQLPTNIVTYNPNTNTISHASMTPSAMYYSTDETTPQVWGLDVSIPRHGNARYIGEFFDAEGNSIYRSGALNLGYPLSISITRVRAGATLLKFYLVGSKNTSLVLDTQTVTLMTLPKDVVPADDIVISLTNESYHLPVKSNGATIDGFDVNSIRPHLSVYRNGQVLGTLFSSNPDENWDTKLPVSNRTSFVLRVKSVSGGISGVTAASTSSPRRGYYLSPNGFSGTSANNIESATGTIEIFIRDKDGALLIFERTITFAKVRQGANAKFVYLETSTPLITISNSGIPNSTTLGFYIKMIDGESPPVDTGNYYIATEAKTIATGEWVSYLTPSKRQNRVITLSSPVLNLYSEFKATIYTDSTLTNVIDTQSVPIVREPANADNSISAILTNESHTIPFTGTSAKLSGSGTTILVYDGATKLECDGYGTTNGTYNVLMQSSPNIYVSTESTLTATGDFIFMGVSGANPESSPTGYIDFTISGKSLNGKDFSFVRRMTFSLLREYSLTTYSLKANVSFIKVDQNGAVSLPGATSIVLSMLSNAGRYDQAQSSHIYRYGGTLYWYFHGGSRDGQLISSTTIDPQMPTSSTSLALTAISTTIRNYPDLQGIKIATSESPMAESPRHSAEVIIPILRDGVKGTAGEAGITVLLSNENISMMKKASGTSLVLESEIVVDVGVFVGTTKLTPSSTTSSSSLSNGQYFVTSTSTVGVPSRSIVDGQARIQLPATTVVTSAPNITLTLKITGKRSDGTVFETTRAANVLFVENNFVYEIVPTRSHITLDKNNSIGSTFVNAQILRREKGTTAPVLATESIKIEARYKTAGNATVGSAILSTTITTGQLTIPLNASTIASDALIEHVEILGYIGTSSVVFDRVTVPIIREALSTVTPILSIENITIPIKPDGTWGNEYTGFNLQVYEGTQALTPQTSGTLTNGYFTVTRTLSLGASSQTMTANTTTKVMSFANFSNIDRTAFGDAKSFTVNLTISYKRLNGTTGTLEKKVNYSIIEDGTAPIIYNLETSGTDALIIDKNGSVNGVSSTLTVPLQLFQSRQGVEDGQKVLVPAISVNAMVDFYNKGLDTWNELKTQTFTTGTMNLTLTSSNLTVLKNNASSIRVRLYRRDTSNQYSIYIDTVTIPIIRDGTDGTSGSDGLTVVLSNEAHTIFRSGNQIYDVQNSGSRIVAYEGTSKLSPLLNANTVMNGSYYANVTFSTTGVSATLSIVNGELVLSDLTTSGILPSAITANIDVSIRRMNSTVSTIRKSIQYTIVESGKNPSVFELSANQNAVKVNKNKQWANSVLTFSLYEHKSNADGVSTRSIATQSIRFILYSKVGTSNAVQISSTTVTTGVATINMTQAHITQGVTHFIAEAYDASGNMLDIISIPVVIDAIDGVVLNIWTPQGNIIKNGAGSVTIQADLYSGNAIQTSGVTYKWYAQDPSATTSSGGDNDGGAGWRLLNSSYTQNGVTGYTTKTLTVPAAAVVGSEAFKVAATYNSGKYAAATTIIDVTDPITVLITGVDILKTGVSSTTLKALVMQNGQDIDPNGATYNYSWKMYTPQNVLVPGFNKAGKSITVTATDISNTVSIICEVSKK